ncbi:MAG: hypothetical protein ACP5H5_07995 [Pyrobaculum sp.]
MTLARYRQYDPYEFQLSFDFRSLAQEMGYNITFVFQLSFDFWTHITRRRHMPR